MLLFLALAATATSQVGVSSAHAPSQGGQTTAAIDKESEVVNTSADEVLANFSKLDRRGQEAVRDLLRRLSSSDSDPLPRSFPSGDEPFSPLVGKRKETESASDDTTHDSPSSLKISRRRRVPNKEQKKLSRNQDRISNATLFAADSHANVSAGSAVITASTKVQGAITATAQNAITDLFTSTAGAGRS